MPRRAAGQERRRRRSRWFRRGALTLLGLVLVLLIGGSAVFVRAGTQLRQTPALAAYPGRPAPGEGRNWLLVGSDSRSDLTARERKRLHVGGGAGRNTDTIMLLHHGRSGPYLISLPRDSYVPVPGHGKRKINSAFALGGPKLLTRTVERATGLRLDHYAEVDFHGFTEVVDALGGVRICLHEPLRDELSGADLPKGCRTADGARALAYVRARHSDPRGDLGRVERQRRLLGALAEEVAEPHVLLNPFRLVRVLDTTLAAVTVDGHTGVLDLGRLGGALREIAGGAGATAAVPVSGSGTVVGGAGDVLLWDRGKAARLFGALRKDRPIPDFGSK